MTEADMSDFVFDHPEICFHENESSKYQSAVMAKAGVFEGIDIALCWHPSDDNTLDNTFMACVSFDLTFHGVASHAAGAPWEGRSALDAIELMNVGVNFLREHVTPDTRIHYAYLDAGGSAPNVVQPFAKVRYCVRANKADYVEEVFNRVIDIAKGACLMTGTTMDDPFVYSAFSDMIQNSTLDKLLLKNLDEQMLMYSHFWFFPSRDSSVFRLHRTLAEKKVVTC